MSMNYNELESTPGLQATSSFPFMSDLKFTTSFDVGTSYLPANEAFELNVEMDDLPNIRAKLAPTSFKIPLLCVCEEKMPTCKYYTEEMETEFLKDKDLDLDEDINYMCSTRKSENLGPDGTRSHIPDEYYPSESEMGNYFDNYTPTVLNQSIFPFPIESQITQNIPPMTMTRTEEEVKKEKESESDGNCVSDGESEEYEEEPKRGYKKRIAPEVTNGHRTKAGRWTLDEHNKLTEVVREYEGIRVSWNEVAIRVQGRLPKQCKSHWQKFHKTLFVEKNINIDELNKSKKFMQKEREEIKAYGLKPFALNGIAKTILDRDNLLLIIHFLIKDIDSKLNTVSLKDKKSNKKDRKQNKKRNISN